MPAQGLNIKLQLILPDKDKLPGAKFEKVLSKLEKYMKGELSRELKTEFTRTTTGWKRYPSFVAVYSEPYAGARMMLWVKPFGRNKTKWSWISMGTRLRSIESKKGPMHYQKDFTPKTTPSGNYGGPGVKSGVWVHPGYTTGPHKIEPRRFSVLIKKNKEAKIQKDIIQIVRKVTG